MPAPRAVLWDMDGTLVDTEPYWIETEFALAERHGGSWSLEHALALVGNDLLDSGRYIREHMGIDREPREIVEELLDGVVERVRRAVPWRPGARELLGELGAAGVPCALVTMSWQRFVDPILEHLPTDTFRTVVTGDSVGAGKPHPEPYLTAAAELGVDPSDCVAIEDSDTGARSAEAAGCRVLCVPHHVDVAAGPRRTFLPSLEGVTPRHLGDLLPV
jgi:HAD superfamily hydrolase (TIGR01509 family)